MPKLSIASPGSPDTSWEPEGKEALHSQHEARAQTPAQVQAGGGGGHRRLLRAGVPYLAVGRRGGPRVQLPAAGKGEREREEGEDKQAVHVSPSASTRAK